MNESRKEKMRDRRRCVIGEDERSERDQRRPKEKKNRLKEEMKVSFLLLLLKCILINFYFNKFE